MHFEQSGPLLKIAKLFFYKNKTCTTTTNKNQSKQRYFRKEFLILIIRKTKIDSSLTANDGQGDSRCTMVVIVLVLLFILILASFILKAYWTNLIIT